MVRPLTWAFVLILTLVVIAIDQFSLVHIRAVEKLALNQQTSESSPASGQTDSMFRVSPSRIAVTNVSGALYSAPAVESSSKEFSFGVQNVPVESQPKTFWQRLTGFFQMSLPQKNRQDLREKVRQGELDSRESTNEEFKIQV